MLTVTPLSADPGTNDEGCQYGQTSLRIAFVSAVAKLFRRVVSLNCQVVRRACLV